MKYDVHIQNGLAFQSWSSLGGEKGPFSKKTAQNYVDAFWSNGIQAQLVEAPSPRKRKKA